MFNYVQFLEFVPDTLSIVVGLARVTPASLNTDKAQQAKKTFGAHSLWWCLKMQCLLRKSWSLEYDDENYLLHSSRN